MLLTMEVLHHTEYDMEDDKIHSKRGRFSRFVALYPMVQVL